MSTPQQAHRLWPAHHTRTEQNRPTLTATHFMAVLALRVCRGCRPSGGPIAFNVPLPPTSPSPAGCRSLVRTVAYHRAPGRHPCRHGVQCYRRNPQHWTEFDHPARHPWLSAPALSSLDHAPTGPAIIVWRSRQGKRRLVAGDSRGDDHEEVVEEEEEEEEATVFVPTKKPRLVASSSQEEEFTTADGNDDEEPAVPICSAAEDVLLEAHQESCSGSCLDIEAVNGSSEAESAAAISSDDEGSVPIISSSRDEALVATRRGKPRRVAPSSSDEAPVATRRGKPRRVATSSSDEALVATRRGKPRRIATSSSDEAPVATRRGKPRRVATSSSDEAPVATRRGKPRRVATSSSDEAPVAMRREKGRRVATSSRAAESPPLIPAGGDAAGCTPPRRNKRPTPHAPKNKKPRKRRADLEEESRDLLKYFHEACASPIQSSPPAPSDSRPDSTDEEAAPAIPPLCRNCQPPRQMQLSQRKEDGKRYFWCRGCKGQGHSSFEWASEAASRPSQGGPRCPCGQRSLAIKGAKERLWVCANTREPCSFEQLVATQQGARPGPYPGSSCQPFLGARVCTGRWGVRILPLHP